MISFCLPRHVLIPLVSYVNKRILTFSSSITVYFVDQQFPIFNHNIYMRKEIIWPHQEDVY